MVEISQDDKKTTEIVKLIDFETPSNNDFLVGIEAKIGSLSSGFDRFMYWRYIYKEQKEKFEYQLETLIKGVF